MVNLSDQRSVVARDRRTDTYLCCEVFFTQLLAVTVFTHGSEPALLYLFIKCSSLPRAPGVIVTCSTSHRAAVTPTIHQDSSANQNEPGQVYEK